MLADYLAKVGRHRPIGPRDRRQRTPAGYHVVAESTDRHYGQPSRYYAGSELPRTFLAQPVCGGALAQGSAGMPRPRPHD
jgi:hypothetical protein